MRDERHKVLLQTQLTADCQSVKWRSSLSLFNQYWFTWYPPLFPLQHTAQICVRAGKVSGTFWEIAATFFSPILKLDRKLDMKLVTLFMLRHLLRGLNLNKALWNTDYTVALEHLKLMSFVLLDCVSPVTSATCQSPPQLPWRALREGGAGGGGERIKRAGITSDWRAKEREKSECTGSVSLNERFLMSARSNLLTCGRRWRAERGGWLMRLPPDEAQPTLILTQGRLFSHDALLSDI